MDFVIIFAVLLGLFFGVPVLIGLLMIANDWLKEQPFWYTIVFIVVTCAGLAAFITWT